jgi:hypothetical protein
VSLVLEEFVRMLHACGMPLTDVDIMAGRGRVMNEILLQGEPPHRTTAQHSTSTSRAFIIT